jgi:hypothetical protein
VSNDTKKCPFCAETIKAEAIVCRFCKRDLPHGPPPVPATQYGIKWKYMVALIIILAIIGLLVIIQFSYHSSETTLPSVRYPAVLEKHTVTYRVKGTTTRAALTYENAQGGTEQTEVAVPWEKTFTFDHGDFVYISAANRNDRGTIVCEIWVDGEKWKESTSQGAYTIATCSGSAGRD